MFQQITYQACRYLFYVSKELFGFFRNHLPYCHNTGPFSWKKPSSEEHPGPPLSQMVISSVAFTLEDGKNQKYSSLVSFAFSEMGKRPA